MRVNSVKKALKVGKVQLGCGFAQLRSPEVARILAAAGFQWTFLDSEHGGFDLETLQDLCEAAAVVGLIVLNVHTQRTFRNVKPLVIRIDDVGHAAAVSYDSLTYTPQAPELKYFLVQFVTKHYSRMRATVRQQYAESLYFLDGRLADATIETNNKSGTIERFLTSGGEEIDIRVKNVTLDDLRQPPFRATVDFDKVSLSPATRGELRRDAQCRRRGYLGRPGSPSETRRRWA
jgi:hypothetical protein